MLQQINDQRKILIRTSFGGLHRFFGLIQKCDPGIIITASIDKIIARALKQPIAVLFPDNELVNIAYSTQYKVEVLEPLLRLLAVG